MMLGDPDMDWSHGLAAAADVLASSLYFVAVMLIRLRAELLRRERNASWVREVVA